MSIFFNGIKKLCEFIIALKNNYDLLLFIFLFFVTFFLVIQQEHHKEKHFSNFIILYKIEVSYKPICS